MADSSLCLPARTPRAVSISIHYVHALVIEWLLVLLVLRVVWELVFCIYLHMGQLGTLGRSSGRGSGCLQLQCKHNQMCQVFVQDVCVVIAGY
jgi:hypothetical protein